MIIVDQRKCNGKIGTITTRQSMYVYGIGSKYMDFFVTKQFLHRQHPAFRLFSLVKEQGIIIMRD